MELNRGINLGGFLSQCIYTEEHYHTFIVDKDLENIAKLGFDHVRLPIDYNFFETEDGTYIPDHFIMLDNIIKKCQSLQLNVIIDLHKAYGYDFNDAGNAEKNNLFSDAKLQDRFLKLWEKISDTFGKYNHVAFELLNEVVEEENASAWNSLISKAVAAIRKHAAESLIIYGGIQWNSAKTVKYLDRPTDKNILFTFHFYEPLLFTHQKAPWVAAMDPDESVPYPESMEYYKSHSRKLGFQGEVVTKADAKLIGPEFYEELILEAIEAANKAGVGLYCGEFGVIDRAPVPDTLRWYKDVDATFRKYNIGCAAWSYKLMDFGITDPHYADIFDEIIHLWINK